MFDSFAEEVLDPNNKNARQMLEDNKKKVFDGKKFGSFKTDEYEAGDSEADIYARDIMITLHGE